MSLPKISAAQARRLVDEGAVLVDIREHDEHIRENIAGAFHLPLSRLDEVEIALQEGKPVIFHCKSGMRTSANAARLAQKVGGACEAFVVEGGINALKSAGLPVAPDRKQPAGTQEAGVGSPGLLGALMGVFRRG
jgi:rhodanese-related sulfurtransferase